MTITGFEIDFLKVGPIYSSGDAILFRYREDGECKIILIDGGWKESSVTILNHMRNIYKSDRIDHIVCSHPDADHIGGLEEVMNECKVGTLWINDPLDYVSRSDLAEGSDADGFSKAHADKVKELKKIAESNNISIDEPLQGRAIGPLIVASPSEGFYEKLVKGQMNEEVSLSEAVRGLVRALWDKDYLRERPVTSVCNESSTVLFGDLVESRILLTADAGIEALSRAYKYLKNECSFESGSLTCIQVPHHGSRRNVNVEILNKLLGGKVLQGNKHGSSFVSVAKNSKTHPRESVTNAFLTRGYPCYETKGKCVRHRSNMPDREGWSASTPIEYHNIFKESDN